MLTYIVLLTQDRVRERHYWKIGDFGIATAGTSKRLLATERGRGINYYLVLRFSFSSHLLPHILTQSTYGVWKSYCMNSLPARNHFTPMTKYSVIHATKQNVRKCLLANLTSSFADSDGTKWNHFVNRRGKHLSGTSSPILRLF